MRRRSTVGYALLGGLVGILAFEFLFPAILSFGPLFRGLVALLLVGGLVSAVIDARQMFRR